MMVYTAKLGPYLMANYPNATEAQRLATYSETDGFGLIWDGSLGPAPAPEQVEAWQPASNPVVEVAANYAQAKSYAADRLNTLMASVAVAMIMGGMDQDATNAAGSAFVVQHASLIQAWLLTGGNHVVGQALIKAIAASPPKWWSLKIEAIFAAVLA